MKLFGYLLAVLFSVSEAHAGNHVCAHDARIQAAKLFALHYDLDEAKATEAINENVVTLKPVPSPNGKMKYDVLETRAYIGNSGEFRIRLIYAVFPDPKRVTHCLLMGQEILDLSSL